MPTAQDKQVNRVYLSSFRNYRSKAEVKSEISKSTRKMVKRFLAEEAGSLASLNEYFGNLPFQQGRCSSWKMTKLGNKMELLEVPFSKTNTYSTGNYLNFPKINEKLPVQ